MRCKEFIELFVPPIYYKVKKRLFPKKQPVHHPLPKVEHEKKRMVVIGNGPSLNKTLELYLPQILESDIVMVNYSVRTPLFEQLKPSYYAIMDPSFAFDNPDDIDVIRDCVHDLVERTQWPMILVLPKFFKSWWAVDEFKKNSNITVLFDGGDWRRLPDAKLFHALDVNRVCPPTNTTLTYCIYMSLYWGYEETYLVGADMSFLKDMYVGQKDNVLYTIDSHFYNNSDVQPEPTDPEFKGRPFRHTMEEKLYEYYIVFSEYNMLNRYAKWKGLKLYNASEYSMIDCLERKKLS